MIRKIIRRIITLAILAALGWGFYIFGSRYLWPAVNTTKIAAVGMIEAPEVNITSRIPGRIAKLTLIEGDPVHKGEVVCEIEDIDLRNQLAQARASLEKAMADLAQARRDSARDDKLFAEHIIPAKDHDDAKTAVDQDLAAVSNARANVDFYQDQLRDTKILAPVNGVIVSKALEVGEWVTPGTPILTVNDLSTIWARVERRGNRPGLALYRQTRAGAAADQSTADLQRTRNRDRTGRTVRHRARRTPRPPGYPHLLCQSAGAPGRRRFETRNDRGSDVFTQ